MNKHYCIHCGSGTSYEFEKPKFCGSCGQPFAGTVVAAKKPVKLTPRPITLMRDEEDNQEESGLPEIEKENFFEITGIEPRVFKGEDLVSTSKEVRQPRTRAVAVDKEKVLKNFSQRAASKTKIIEAK